MLSALIPVAWLLLSIVLMQVGTGLATTFLGIRMYLEGFPDLAVGLVGSAYFIGFILGALYGDRVIQTVGHVRAFTGLGALTCGTVLAMSFHFEPLYWSLLRVIAGFCTSGVFMVVEAWMNERADDDNRGSVFAAYMVVAYVSLGAGQYLINLADPAGLYPFLIAGLFFVCALAPVALGPATIPIAYERQSFGVARLYNISPLGIAGCLVTGLINGAFYAMMPIFAARHSFAVDQIANIMGLTILAGFVFQLPIGRLSDRFDRRTVLVAVLFATAIVAGGLTYAAFFLQLPYGVLLPAMCVYGAVAFSIYPLAVAHANDFVPAKDTVRVMSGLLLAYGVGAAIGPFAASLVMEGVGGGGLFAFIAISTTAVALFGLLRMRLRHAAPIDEQGPFIALPRTSPVLVAEMNPLAEVEDAEFEEADDDGSAPVLEAEDNGPQR